MKDKIKKIKGKLAEMAQKALPCLKKAVSEEKQSISDKLIKNPTAAKIFKLLGYIAAVLFPLACFAQAELLGSGWIAWFLNFLKTQTKVALFSVGLLYLIYFLLVLIFRKFTVPAFILWTGTAALPIASYMKYSTTGDYLYPWDFQQTGNVDLLLEYSNAKIPPFFIVIVFAVLLACLFIAFTAPSLRIKHFVRLPALALILVICFFSLNSEAKINSLVERNGMSFVDGFLPSNSYVENGFIGAFTMNILSTFADEPEGYSAEKLAEIASGLEEKEQKEDFASPDVILILSESFWDVTRLSGVDFSYDPLANFREIASRGNTYSGTFYTTGFGGGTVRPEFEVLTGLTTDYMPAGCVPYQYVREKLQSYPALFKDMGYRTLAVHPYLSNFYQRESKYPYLGFDETYFEEDLYAIGEIEYSIRGKNISDDSFIDYMTHFMDDSDSPTFLFGISMEAHQPYPNKFTEEEFDLALSSEKLDADTLNIVRQYAQCIADADKALKKLVDWADSREKETVIVYFGDHAPSLGANYAAYVQSGEVKDPAAFTSEERLLLQTTPFMIFSNFELGESEIIKKGSENHIPSYQLMNAACSLMGTEQTGLMSFLSEYKSALPYFNSRLGMEITEAQSEYVEAHRYITYDIVFGKKYFYDNFG